MMNRRNFEECPICLDRIVGPVLLSCLHLVCSKCFSDCVKEAQENGIGQKCLICSEPVGQIFSTPVLDQLCRTTEPSADDCQQNELLDHQQHPLFSQGEIIQEQFSNLKALGDNIASALVPLDQALVRSEKQLSDLQTMVPKITAQIEASFRAVYEKLLTQHSTIEGDATEGDATQDVNPKKRKAEKLEQIEPRKRQMSRLQHDIMLILPILWQNSSQNESEQLYETPKQPLDAVTATEAQKVHAVLQRNNVLTPEVFMSEYKARCAALIEQAQTELDADIKVLHLHIAHLEVSRDLMLTTAHHASTLALLFDSTSLVFDEHLSKICDLVITRARSLLEAQREDQLVSSVNTTVEFVFPDDFATALMYKMDQLGFVHRVHRDYTSISATPVRELTSLEVQADSVGANEPATLTSLQAPLNVTSKMQHLYVVDSMRNQIKVLDTLSGAETRAINVKFKPCHAAFAEDGSYCLTTHLYDRLQLFQSNGTIIKEIFFPNVWDVIILPNKNIVASSYQMPGIIQAYSPAGEQLWISNSNLAYISSMVASPDGLEIIVCGHNSKCLHVISAADGSFLRNLAPDVVNEPFALAITKDKHLVICENNSQISICNLYGDLIHRWQVPSKSLSSNEPPSLSSVCIADDGSIVVADTKHRSLLFF